MKLNTNILLAPAETGAGGGGKSEVETLREQNAALLAENTTLKKSGEIEEAVRAKMALGLTREQAESVVKQQADTDKEIARLEAEQNKARKK